VLPLPPPCPRQLHVAESLAPRSQLSSFPELSAPPLSALPKLCSEFRVQSLNCEQSALLLPLLTFLLSCSSPSLHKASRHATIQRLRYLLRPRRLGDGKRRSGWGHRPAWRRSHIVRTCAPVAAAAVAAAAPLAAAVPAAALATSVATATAEAEPVAAAAEPAPAIAVATAESRATGTRLRRHVLY
jgi:hypothetical protein